MWGYTMFENGVRRTYGDVLREAPRLYQTDVLGETAVDFIRRRAPDDAPFFLSVAFLAPHHESGFTQRQTGHLVRAAHGTAGGSRMPPFDARSYNEQDVLDKPWFIGRWNRPLTASRDAAIVTRMRERWESLLAVDDAVARIIGALKRAGELDETYVIFTSDNGYMQGEHRVPSARCFPTTRPRVPLLMRGAAAQRPRDEGAGGQHRPRSHDPAGGRGADATPTRRALLPAVRPRCPAAQPASAAPRDGWQRRARPEQHTGRQRETGAAARACLACGPARRVGCTWTTRAVSASSTTSGAIRLSCAPWPAIRGFGCACARCAPDPLRPDPLPGSECQRWAAASVR